MCGINFGHLSIWIYSQSLCCIDGDEDKKQFLRKLTRLKKQSSIFLRMLNDMRRRLKELPPDATAARSYKYE